MNTFDKLNKRFPTGIVAGLAKAVVGQFGLTVCYINKFGKRYETKYCEGRTLPIVEIKGEILEIADAVPHAHIHYKYFKGFEVIIFN